MAIRLRRQPTKTGWSDAGSVLLASALRVTSMPMPAGSPRAISSCWLALASNGDGMVCAETVLLGLMLVGLATGLHQQWLVVDWLKITDDLGLPAPEDLEPIDSTA